ncbi:hypothetical protein JKP88DRAFT_321862 [Tribonema minus]|uniref:Uncharacterized protein n=1 Tax=Tribonema minus TaxID=303371 RepID=A0A836CEX2_9STRA|nr:hypothetical protein JKP88DRAFT_321862 [Tribonema minus]
MRRSPTQRLQNIERNMLKLLELGVTPRGVSHRAPLRQAPRPRKKQRQQDPAAALAVPARKSLRLSGKEAVKYADPPDSPTGRRKSPAAPHPASDDDDGSASPLNSALTARVRSAAPAPPPAADSSRALDCDVAGLLRSYLGAPVPAFGKAAAMALACADRGVTPKFSKLSGSTEWRNAVVFWVNAGGAYANAFLDGGERLTWFAGARQTRDTPVIRRVLATADAALPPAAAAAVTALNVTTQPTAAAPQTCASLEEASAAAAPPAVAAAAAAAAANGVDASAERCSPTAAPPSQARPPQQPQQFSAAPDDGGAPAVAPPPPCALLLFCRLPGEPYVFCGRLALAHSDLRASPLAFTWRLLDAPTLRASSPHFAALLSAGDGGGGDGGGGGGSNGGDGCGGGSSGGGSGGE